MSNFSFSLEDFLSGNMDDAVDREMHKDLKDPTKPLRTTGSLAGSDSLNVLSIGEILMGTKNFNSSQDVYEMQEAAFSHMLTGFTASDAGEGLKQSGANYDILIPADIRAAAKKYRDQYGGGKEKDGDNSTDTTPAGNSRGDLPAIPVEGVGPEAITDTQGAARSFGGTHKGTDIFAAEGTNVLAAWSGKIVAAGQANDFDIRIALESDEDSKSFGKRYHFYDHLGSVAVAAGDTVSKGQKIGKIGIVHDGQPGGQPSIARHLHFSNNSSRSETNDIQIAHWLKTGEYRAR